MTADNANATVHLDGPAHSHEPRSVLRTWWRAVTALLVAGIFMQAVFAGAMLSGDAWASSAHSVTAVILIASTIAAGLVAAVTLRRVPHGPKLILTLAVLAAAVFLQTAVGKLAANGANLMWVHIPLGVALVALAGQAVAGARKIGRQFTG